MTKTIKVRLGDDDYEVPRFNIGQLEEIAEMQTETMSPRKFSFAVLDIALRRATPPIERVTDIECTFQQLQTAFEAVMRHAGLDVGGDTPASGEPPAAA